MELLRQLEPSLQISFNYNDMLAGNEWSSAAFGRWGCGMTEEQLARARDPTPIKITIDRQSSMSMTIKWPTLDELTQNTLISALGEFMQQDLNTRFTVTRSAVRESAVLDELNPLTQQIRQQHVESMIKFRKLVEQFNAGAQQAGISSRIEPYSYDDDAFDCADADVDECADEYEDECAYDILAPKLQFPTSCYISNTETIQEPGVKIYMHDKSRIWNEIKEWGWFKYGHITQI